MEYEERWRYVEETLKALESETLNINHITETLGIDNESKLILPFDNLKDILITTLGALVNDDTGCIEWFVYECEFGQADMSAGKENEMQVIKTFNDLRWLIELETKLNQ